MSAAGVVAAIPAGAQKKETVNKNLIEALHTEHPATDRADKMSLYGWLIGSWTMDAAIPIDETARTGKGEIYFGWVLEGRAIQDVWIRPNFFYGTTLRIYDPKIDAWHIIWSDPLQQYYTRQIGRKKGNDIVQEGTNEAGELSRWSFTNITPDSFHWHGEHSTDQGKTWKVQAEFYANRVMT